MAVIDRSPAVGKLTVFTGTMQMGLEAERREVDGTRAREIAGEVARLARSLLGSETQVIWFGSWPRGNALAHSDIDVAVSIGQPIPMERLVLLHDAIDEIATLYEIDMVDLGTTGPALHDEILKHGERL